MKLKLKLLLLLFVTIVSFGAICFYQINELNKMNEDYHIILSKTLVPNIEKSLQIQLNFKKQVQEWKNIQLRGHNPKQLEKFTKKFFEKEKEVQDSSISLKNNVNNKELKDLLNSFIIAHQILGKDYRNALDIYINTGFDFKASDLAVEGKDRKPTDIFDTVVDKFKEISNNEFENFKKRNELTIKYIFIIIILLIISILVLSNLIINNLVKRIDNLKDIANGIANGETNIKLDEKGSDEITSLSKAMNIMINNINSVHDEIINVTNEINKGNISFKSENSSLNGSWNKLIEEINSLVDSFSIPIINTEDYINKISEGYIPEQIQINYNGKFEELKISINNLINTQFQIINFSKNLAEGKIDKFLEPRNENDELIISLNLVSNKVNQLVDSISLVSNNLSIGQLNYRIENNELNGVYSEVIHKINNSLDLVVNYFDINSHLLILDDNYNVTFINKPLLNIFNQHLNVFSNTFGFDITSTTNGNLNFFLNNYSKTKLNKNTEQFNLEIDGNYFVIFIHTIFNRDDDNKFQSKLLNWINVTNQHKFNNELDLLTNELNNGNLNYKIDSNLFSGDYLQLSQSINLMVKNVTTPYNLISDYLTQIKNGIIPDLINNDYKGDYNLIKLSINGLIETIKELTIQLKLTTKEHELGDLDYNAKADNFLGIFKEVVDEINYLINSHVNTKKSAIKVFQDFANGNFDSDLNKLPGKKYFVNEAINSVRNNFINLNNAISELTYAAQQGNLSYRLETNNFNGDWKKLMSDLNLLLDNIIVPINETREIIKDYSLGNLTNEIIGDYDGDFAVLKENVNLFNYRLNEILKKVNDITDTTSITANQLKFSSEIMAASSQEQATQIEEISDSVKIMYNTTSQTANNSTDTYKVAKENGTIAQEGGIAVENTITKMKEIALSVKDSAQSISKLGKSSQEIGDIISVIEDIADQTNLLALNAAIEAARAGEQGRGFAVVADEVRKLAERTSGATKEISKKIKSIQRETFDAVEQMNQGTIEVEKGITLADEAGVSLNRILVSSNELIEKISQISKANEEQAYNSEIISKNIEAISDVINDNAKQIEEIAHSADNLNSQTDNLKDIMSTFKLKSNKQISNKKINNIETKRRYLN